MYIVVFRRNEKSGSLAGTVFVVEYKSKDDFVDQSKKLSAEVSSTRDVIAEGVSREQADWLIRISEVTSYPRCQNCADCPCEC